MIELFRSVLETKPNNQCIVKKIKRAASAHAQSLQILEASQYVK